MSRATQVPIGTLGKNVLISAFGHDCPQCGAPAGENCRTASGRERQWSRFWSNDLTTFERHPKLHSARQLPSDWAALRAADPVA